jgi:hypothetical protein
MPTLVRCTSPPGPEALTVAQVAGIIAGVAGRPVSHHDIERSAWVDGAIAAGAVPPGYGVMLNWLTATIASGRGSRPNDDVRRVTGSPPASFADFAHRHARAWARARYNDHGEWSWPFGVASECRILRRSRAGPRRNTNGSTALPRTGFALCSKRARRPAMAETPFVIGADARCTDGVCGKLIRVVVDPVARRVTHLIGAVTGTVDGVQLNVTKQQVENLPPVNTDQPSG